MKNEQRDEDWDLAATMFFKDIDQHRKSCFQTVTRNILQKVAVC